VTRRTGCHNAFRTCKVHFNVLELKEGPLVPLDAEPSQSHQDAVNQFGLITLNVGVFNTQQKCAAFVLGKKPIKQGGASSADVKKARRGWRKTHARLLSGCHYACEFLPLNGNDHLS